MAMIKLSTKTLRQAVSVGAMALAAVTLAAPTLASAQEAGRQGGWQGRGGGEMRGGQSRGDGRGAGGFQNRGDRAGMPQRQLPTQQPAQTQQEPQSPPQVQAQAAAGARWQGNRDGPDRSGQTYRGDRGNRVQNQRNWTDAQREAYRGAVLEGRDTDQFRNRGDRPSTWQTDRQGSRVNQGQGQWQSRRDDDRRGDRNGWQNDGRARESWRNNGSRDNRSWDRGWRSNNRYDWSSYRSRNRNIFSAGRYYSPFQNYSYRRVGIGLSLGSQFYGSRYLINDPYYYRLPEVYGPYRWVRYYDDVLLVDIYSGQVVDAIYDFFY